MLSRNAWINIEYAVAFAGSEVVNGNALVVSQVSGWLLHGRVPGQQHGCNRGHRFRPEYRVVIAEDTDASQLADGNLCDIRKQVVRDALRILADQAALVRSDRVEVAEQDNIPFRICHVQVS